MKKLILLIVLLLLFTGCSKNVSTNRTDDLSPPVTTTAPTETITPTEPEPSKGSEIAPAESVLYPLLDKEITEALTDKMYGSFGGDEQFAAGWYKYIDYWEVYQNEDFYSGILHLKERPFDASARLLLAQYYTEEDLDFLCPTLLDVGAALNLDDVDLCLIGEALYKICTLENTEIYYASLAALNIPVYDVLAEANGNGWTANDVKRAIKDEQIHGETAFACLVDYMDYTYDGSFDGLSMEKVKTMSMAALANFNDVRIETLSVVDHENKSINKYKNQKFVDNSSDKEKVSDVEYKTYSADKFTYNIPSTWDVDDKDGFVFYYPESGLLIFQSFDTGGNDYTIEELSDGYFIGLSMTVSDYTEISSQFININPAIEAKEVMYYSSINNIKYENIGTVFYIDSTLYSFVYTHPDKIKDMPVYQDIINSITLN